MGRFFSLYICICLGVIALSGCKTISADSRASQQETSEEVAQALESVANALSAQELSEEDFKALTQQIREDEQAQQAIESITEVLAGSEQAVNYCPLTGDRYALNIKVCPKHNVPLKTE